MTDLGTDPVDGQTGPDPDAPVYQAPHLPDPIPDPDNEQRKGETGGDGG